MDIIHYWWNYFTRAIHVIMPETFYAIRVVSYL